MSILLNKSTEMHNSINYIPKINIAPKSTLIVEPSATLAYNKVLLKTEKIAKSIVDSMSAAFWSGESMWHNKFTAEEEAGWVALDGGVNLVEHTLNPGQSLYLNATTLTARDEHVNLSTETKGISGIWSGMGIVVQKLTNMDVSKPGRVFFSTRGYELKKLEITPSEGIVHIDAHNLLGYTSGLQLVSSDFANKTILEGLTSGEFVTNAFQGQGTAFVRVNKYPITNR